MAGVRQVDHHDVEGLAFGGKPFDLDEGVRLDDHDAGIGERALVEPDQGLAQHAGAFASSPENRSTSSASSRSAVDRVGIPPEQSAKCQTIRRRRGPIAVRGGKWLPSPGT